MSADWRKRGRASAVRAHLRRGIFVGLSTFAFATLIVLPSVGAVDRAPLYLAIPILLLIVAVGIAFDILGVAVTAAEEEPFHALASKRQPGARQAIWLIRNADRVSNFCNDIVGDVAGTIGGAVAAAIAVQLVTALRLHEVADVVNMLTIGAVAGLTVGGKAWGKGFALRESGTVVRQASRLMQWFGIRTKAGRGGGSRPRRARSEGRAP